MKKLVLCSICSLVALTMVGCSGSSTDSAIKDLNKQLSRVETSITEINKQDLSSLQLNTFYSNGFSNNLNNEYYGIQRNNTIPMTSKSLMYAKSKVANDLNLQNSLSNLINNNIDSIQASIKNNKTKYNKNQIKALNSLVGQLSSTISKVNVSKDEVNSGLKTIKYNQNVNHTSLDQLNAGYNSVSNVLETRKAYFYNILNTLSQIQGIVGNNENCDNCDNSQNQTTPNTQTQNNEENQENQNNARRNINIPDNFNANNQTSTETLPPRIIDNTNGNFANNPYYRYNYNNGYYGNNYAYNGYGMYGYGNTMINPSRNTDTYRPFRVNIDTYRFNPNNKIYNGFYGGNMVAPVSKINEEEIPTQQSAEVQEKKDEIRKKKSVEFDKSLQSKPDAKKLMDQNKNMNNIRKLLKKAEGNSFSVNDKEVNPIDKITYDNEEAPKKVRLNETSEKTSFSKPIKTNHHMN